MWQTEMVLMVRYIIDDLDDPPRYSDERLETLIVLAAKMAKVEVQFKYDYTVVVDPASISPDPTDPESLDEDFQVLVSLKAACLLGSSKLGTGGAAGMSISDGQTKTDTNGMAKGLQLAAKTACQDYNNAKNQFVNGTFTGGMVILSPFRVGTYGAGNYYLSRREGPFSF